MTKLNQHINQYQHHLTQLLQMLLSKESKHSNSIEENQKKTNDQFVTHS